jgi:hypothetical protein
MPSKDLLKMKRKVHPNSLKALAESRKPFKKNDPTTGEKDERINRKGAPDSTSAMRLLIRSIGADLIQLSDTSLSKNKRTRIVSRITNLITEMYESSNPADRIALLKGGWPGLLSEEGDEAKKPKEVVLKIVYENRRVTSEEAELAEAIDAEEAPNNPDNSDTGSSIISGPHPYDRWGLQDLTHENKNITQSGSFEGEEGPTELPQDIVDKIGELMGQPKPSSRKRLFPEGEFYCVLCKTTRSGKARSSIQAGGWVCDQHPEAQ